MAQNIRRVAALGVFAGTMGVGYLLMKLTVPDKDKLMEKMSEDLTDQSRLKKIEHQNQQLMRVIQKNIASSDPVWKLKTLDDGDSK